MKMKSPLSRLVIFFSLISLTVTSFAMSMPNSSDKNNNTFDIASKIFVDGKLISTPRIVAHANQEAAIAIFNKQQSEGLKMKVLARDAAMPGVKDAIAINFHVLYKHNGEQIASNPAFVLVPDQEGKIKFSQAGHLFEMDLIAKRV